MFRETPCIFFYVVTTAFAGFFIFFVCGWSSCFRLFFCFVATFQIKVVNGNDRHFLYVLHAVLILYS